MLIMLVIARSLAFFSALNGFKRKRLVYITMSVLFLDALTPFIRNILFLDPLFMFEIISALSKIFLYISLLLFVRENTIPSVLKIKLVKKETAKVLNPEQELKLLNQNFELGIITEEEYKAQRADIISKL